MLPVQLGLWVSLSVAFITVAVMFVMLYFSRHSIGEEALEKAQQTLDCTVMNISNRMREIEIASKNMCWNVEHHLDEPDSMVTYCDRFITYNSGVVGCDIVFAPNYYKDKGKDEFFSTYVFRCREIGDSKLMTHDPTVLEPCELGEAPYVAANWYFIPMQADTTVWVRPHVPGETFLSNIVTCSTPIHDSTGRPVGVFAVDIALEDISRHVLETKPYPNSYCAMLGVQGTYIIHPDTAKLYHGLVSDVLKDEPDVRLKELVESMLAGETGYRQVTLNGEEHYVFYEALNEKHWSACIVCPESDIFAAYYKSRVAIIIAAIIGILCIFVFSIYFTLVQLKPLALLENSAKRIAECDFSDAIPASTRKDEIGKLQNSFCTMQKSLKQKVDEVSQVSEELRLHGERLTAAYEQAKAADRMKNDILHKHADKMIPPATVIDSTVNEIRNRKEFLVKADLKKMNDKIVSNAQEIALVVNEMLQIHKEKKS